MRTNDKILKAFDKKAEEYKKYGDSSRRIQEIRKVVVETMQELNQPNKTDEEQSHE